MRVSSDFFYKVSPGIIPEVSPELIQKYFFLKFLWQFIRECIQKKTQTLPVNPPEIHLGVALVPPKNVTEVPV